LAENERLWMLSLSQERYNVGKSLLDHLVYAQSWGGYDEDTMGVFNEQISSLQGAWGGGGSLADDLDRIAQYKLPSDEMALGGEGLVGARRVREQLEEAIAITEARYGMSTSAGGTAMAISERDDLLQKYRALYNTITYMIPLVKDNLYNFRMYPDLKEQYTDELAELIGVTGQGGALFDTKMKMAELRSMDFSGLQLEALQKRMALAEMTPSLDDDIGIQREIVSFWGTKLNRLMSSGGSDADITEAASSFRSAKEALSGMVDERREMPLGEFQRQLALAGLTPDMQDDIDVQRDIVEYWRQRLYRLTTVWNGTDSQVAEAANGLSSSRDLLAQMVTQRAMSPLAEFEKQMALAQLTPDFKDDISVQRDVVEFWEARLRKLLNSNGTTEAITEAARSLKSARDTLETLRAPGDVEGAKAALLADMLRTANLRTAVSQKQYAVLDQFAEGTPFVPQTGPYMLHRGEQVIPANQNGPEIRVVIEDNRTRVFVDGQEEKAIVQRGSRRYGSRPAPGAVGR
jgi:hypothetical protein